MQLEGLSYGCDLKDQRQRDELLSRLRKHKPRLAIVEFPCSKWSSLSVLNASKVNGGRQRLKKLRRLEQPLVSFSADIAWEQFNRGDDVLIENPEASAARRLMCMQKLQKFPRMSYVIGDQCAQGLIDPRTGLPIRKGTWWLSSSPEILDEMKRVCPCNHVHGSPLRYTGTQQYGKNLALNVIKGL